MGGKATTTELSQMVEEGCQKQRSSEMTGGQVDLKNTSEALFYDFQDKHAEQPPWGFTLDILHIRYL